MVRHALIGAYEHISLAFHVDFVAVGTQYHERCSGWYQRPLVQKGEIVIFMYRFDSFS